MRTQAQERVEAERGMSRMLADALNEHCQCISVEHNASVVQTDAAMTPGDIRSVRIADAPVFLSRADVEAMQGVIAAVEAAVRLPQLRDAALARANPIARIDHGPAGVFMGYDFHVTQDGPKLIEINTNAGGAFINAMVGRKQRICCGSAEPQALIALAEGFNDAVPEMFASEWLRQRGGGKPERIAIVDEAPASQYLYPEFLLAQQALQNAGYDTIIADARELAFAGDALVRQGVRIDIVYNRLVDFAFQRPEHAALRMAYESGAAVVTPNPHNHALYADKRNLRLLADRAQLAAWGLSSAHVDALRNVPASVEVTADNADALWEARKQYFFKPDAGHGGKAVYRGDKLAKRVWDEIRAGGYIAQEIAAPSERVVEAAGEKQVYKLDVRFYTYAGRLLLAAARVYQGQTTNFRTPGGGFAPVLIV